MKRTLLITLLASLAWACGGSGEDTDSGNGALTAGAASTSGSSTSAPTDGRTACHLVAEDLGSGDWPPDVFKQFSTDDTENELQRAIIFVNRRDAVVTKPVKALLGCTLTSGTPVPGAKEKFTGNLCLVQADQERVVIWDVLRPFVGPGGFQGAATLSGHLRADGDTFVQTAVNAGPNHFTVTLPDGLSSSSSTLHLVSTANPGDPMRDQYGFEADFACAPVSSDGGSSE